MRARRKAWFALIAGAVWGAAAIDGAARAAPFLTPPPGSSSSAPNPSPPAVQPAPAAPYSPPAPYPPPSNPYAYPPYPPPPPNNSTYPPTYPQTYPPTYPQTYPPTYPPGYPYPYRPSRRWDPEVQERRRAAFHNHDGFYLNMGAGFVFARNTIPNAAAPVEASGAGFAFTAALGGAIARNVVLCVRYQLSDADAHFQDAVRGYDQEGASAETDFLGGALLYYFEDTNVLLGGALGMSWFTVRDDLNFHVVDTRAGFAAALDLGKEWWISPNWGMGLVARGSYGTAKDRSIPDATWTNLGLSLFFSATYN